ncbi:MAG: alpha/beta hydrolase fold domain-containing protein [Actinomycetota bacterium]
MPTVFLALSIVGLVFTVNALRPFPWTFASLPSFFGGWLTSELAPHLLVITGVVSGVLIGAGGLQGTRGWIALGLTVATVAGLGALIVEAEQARDVTEGALVEALGPDYVQAIPPQRSSSYDLRVPWRQLVVPFIQRHPDVERVRNIRYSDEAKRLRLDVYRHRSHPTDCPVLIQIHGSGWSVSNKDQQGKPIMLHMASRGWVCVAPNYRLSPRATWPDHLVDVKAVVAWVKEHATEFGGDPNFIVATGGSAGGHLSAMLAVTPNDPRYQPGFEDADTRIQAAVPIYGLYDFTDGSTAMSRQVGRFFAVAVAKVRPSRSADVLRDASPITHVSPDDPPFFVIHGQHDSLAPVVQARAFVKRLREVSNDPVAYAELPGAQHAFDVFPSIRSAHVVRAVERFADWVHARYVERRDGAAAEGRTQTEMPSATNA